MRILHLIACAALLPLTGAPAFAQGSLLDQGRNLLNQGGIPGMGGGGGNSAAGLSNQQADSGLREALKVATQRTVSRVGKPGGYLDDPAIRIPLPGPLEGAHKLMAGAGTGGMLDDLQTRMNRAAEAAAPKAADIFGTAVSQMTVTDAKGIITGPQDAATQYFRRTTTQPLTAAFRPIVERSLSQAGAMQALQKVQQNMPSGGALGGLAGMAGIGGGSQGIDLIGYAVEQALAGLFHYIGTEEAAIRTNPAARSTELLRSVFGR
jgi:hypothetical protein